MQIVYLLLLYFLLGGACLYLIFCADPHGKGPISIVRRLVFDKFPVAFKKYGEMILGKRILGLIGQSINYICWKNHPLIQIFYIVIVVGGFGLYVRYGFMVFFPNKAISILHIYVGSAFTFICFYIYYKVCTVSPGIINERNIRYETNKYDYDGIMFKEGETCRTCKIKKPARSKHCRVCDVCVSKFDHHCVWVKQCIGERNYKWFILYIGSHSLLCIYGTIVGLGIFLQIIIEQQLLSRTFRNEVTGETISSSWWIVSQYLFYRYTQFSFVLILCAIMGVTLFLFTLYHLWMIRSGRTTNETIKIGDICARIERQIARHTNQLKSSEISEEDKKEIARLRELCERDLKRMDNYGERGLIKNLKIIFAK